MNIICSPRGISKIEHPGQGILDISKSGFSSCVLDFSLDDKQVGMQTFIEKCQKESLKLPIAYAPFVNRKNQKVKKYSNEDLKVLAKESILKAVQIGCKAIVVRPLMEAIEKEKLWEINKSFYLELSDIAKKNSIKILLENQARYCNGHYVRGVLSDGEEAAQWIDELNRMNDADLFGFCVNVGTCNLCAMNMYDFITTLGDRVNAIIISAGDGNHNVSMLPFTSVQDGRLCSDYLKLIRGLRDINYDSDLILELEDTAMATPPLLRTGLLSYAKTVIDYFVWQINLEKNLQKYSSRVLFGAGNMCRNYMKCYGEKYPPIYTCDNNSKLWETEFCGLTIKNPEELKNLPKDTAIFICNIYYRDIEKQLRDMGIQNPIEFFNDEYLQSFHFDRIDAITREAERG